MAAPGFKYSGLWTNNQLEPKRSHRFVLAFPLADHMSFKIKKVNKPSYTTAETSHKFMDKTYWYPGKVEWDPITVTVIDTGGAVTQAVDAISADTGASIMKMLLASGYVTPSESAQSVTGNESTISKSRAAANLAKMTITQYSPAGVNQNLDAINSDATKYGRAADVAVEVWTFKNAWIQKAAFGELNYDNDTMMELTLTIRYDWAVFEKPNIALESHL